MSATWAPRAPRGATTRTAPSCAAVTRVTSWARTASLATVSDLSLKEEKPFEGLWDVAFFPPICAPASNLKREFVTAQTLMSAATPATCVSISVSTSRGGSPACAQKDTSCKAAGCARVSTPPPFPPQNKTPSALCSSVKPPHPHQLHPEPCVVFPLQILMNVKQVSISVTTHKPVSTSSGGTSAWTRTDARTLMCKCLKSE